MRRRKEYSKLFTWNVKLDMRALALFGYDIAIPGSSRGPCLAWQGGFGGAKSLCELLIRMTDLQRKIAGQIFRKSLRNVERRLY